MACCKDTAICSIIRQFSISSPCGEQMCEVINAFWDMVCPEAAGNCYLTALLTKREAILFLLGCEAYSVDMSESHYMMTAQAKADSRSDSRTQSQATGSSQKVMGAHGETIYNEKSDANSVYNSLRIGRAKDSTDGKSFYRDDGRGFGYNKNQSYSFVKNIIDHSLVRGEEHYTKEIGRRRDCNYEFSNNLTNGDGFNVGFIAASFTGTTSQWRKFQRTIQVDTDTIRGKTIVTGRECDAGLTSTRGAHRWEDTFLANISWYEKEHIFRFHNERYDTRKVAHAHSDGAGDGMHEQKEEGNSASQGTSQTIGDSETLRTASRVSNLSAFNIINSQRFTNLQNLYDQVTAQITHLRKRLRANAKPYIDVIPCACSSNCCCMPQQRRLGLEYLSNCGTQTCFTGTGLLRNTGVM